jgi:hypothetical protein
MFSNNIKGNKNKIKIKQTNNQNEEEDIITKIIVGVIISVIGGLILYFITT